MSVDNQSSAKTVSTPRRVTLRRLTVLIPVLAVGLTILKPTFALIILVPVLVAALFPWGLTWSSVEIAAATGWLLGAACAFSDLTTDLGAIAYFFVTGGLLAGSWVLRFPRMILGVPRSCRSPALLLATPVCGLIGLICLMTDRDLALRFALSEPALRAASKKVTPGEHRYFGKEARRMGLLWFAGYHEDGGRVWWSAPATYPATNLIYSRTSPPTHPSGEYRFDKLRGPWWISREFF